MQIIYQTRAAKWLMNTAWITAVAVFASFVAGATYLGGDALNGRIDPGPRYLLCSHGTCREVSEFVWRYSYWHAIAALYLMMGALLLSAIMRATNQAKVSPTK